MSTNLVVLLLLEKELRGPELVRVHDADELAAAPLPGGGAPGPLQQLCHARTGHGAPHYEALDLGWVDNKRC